MSEGNQQVPSWWIQRDPVLCLAIKRNTKSDGLGLGCATNTFMIYIMSWGLNFHFPDRMCGQGHHNDDFHGHHFTLTPLFKFARMDGQQGA
jgi:hypothetical protein